MNEYHTIHSKALFEDDERTKECFVPGLRTSWAMPLEAVGILTLLETEKSMNFVEKLALARRIDDMMRAAKKGQVRR